MRLNKKGFTLVEVLAAVVILGVIGGVAVPSVTNNLNKGHEDYCESNAETMKNMAREYFNDHQTLMPKEIGDKAEVTAKTLIDEKYIDKLTDYDNTPCSLNTSKITIVKLTNSNYDYSYSISCGKCTDIIKDNTTGKENVKASISYTPDGGSNTSSHDITVKINFADNGVPIYSYKYEIYRKTSSGDEIVGGITNYKKYKSKEVDVKLDSQGTYYIKTYAINSVGNKTEAQSRDYTLNYPFSCSNISLSSNKTENVWSNGEFDFTFNKSGGIYSYDVYVRIDGGADTLVINRATNRKSLSYPSSLSHTYEIRIVAYDERGNKCNTRTYTYKQDNIPPTCVTSGGSYTWVNRDVTIYGTDYDNSGTYYQNSGPLRDISRTLTYDTDEDYSPGTVYDIAGNSAYCAADQRVRIDKTAPQCTTSGGNGPGWTNGNVTINGTCSDPYSNGVRSGCATNAQQTLSSDTDTRYSPGTVTDVAGNSTVCGTNEWVRIDKTPPKCRRTGNMEVWRNKASNTLTGHCTDDTVGGASSGCTGDSQKTYTAEGNYSGNPGPVKDNAGNVAQCPNGQIKLDRTPPKIKCHGTSGWTDGTTKVSYTASDSYSGLKSNASGSDNVTSNKTFKVTDNVGLTATCTQQVSHRKRYYKQTRKWEKCHTGTEGHCEGGYVCTSYSSYKDCNYNTVNAATNDCYLKYHGTCTSHMSGNTKECVCQYATSCTTKRGGCASEKWDSCKTYVPSTCKGGYTSWKDYGWGGNCQQSSETCRYTKTKEQYHS